MMSLSRTYTCLASFALAASLSVSRADTASSPVAQAGQTVVSLYDGKVTMTMPTAFVALSSKEIATRFPGARPPQYVFDDRKRRIDVVVTYSPNSVTMEQLPDLQKYMRENLPKVSPGLTVVTNLSAYINGQQWVGLECNSVVPGEKVYNYMYFTSLNDKMLGVSYVSYNDSSSDAPSVIASIRATVHVNATPATSH